MCRVEARRPVLHRTRPLHRRNDEGAAGALEQLGKTLPKEKFAPGREGPTPTEEHLRQGQRYFWLKPGPRHLCAELRPSAAGARPRRVTTSAHRDSESDEDLAAQGVSAARAAPQQPSFARLSVITSGAIDRCGRRELGGTVAIGCPATISDSSWHRRGRAGGAGASFGRADGIGASRCGHPAVDGFSAVITPARLALTACSRGPEPQAVLDIGWVSVLAVPPCGWARRRLGIDIVPTHSHGGPKSGPE